MANVIPDKIAETISFSAAKVALWTGIETSIGLTALEVTALGTKTTTAQTSLVAQAAAQSAARTSTLTLGTNYKSMRASLALIIAKIKAFADTQATPATVYALAGLPVPANPTPAGPPVDATDVRGQINNAGWVVLSWRGSLSHGQFFSVWRQLPTQVGYTQLGAFASKTFVDTTVPSGKAWANYIVKAHRGAQTSAGTEPISVLFGVELAA